MDKPYIDLLITLKKESNAEHYIALFTIPFGLILMTVLEVGVGFTVMLMMLVWDVFRYYKRKGAIQPYLTTFSYILKMLDASKEISKLKIAEVQEYVDHIADIRKKFKKFWFGSSLLMSAQRETGSLAEAFLDYIRVATHIDLLKFNSMLEEVKKNADTIDELAENIGVLDALISVASFRESLPFYSIPELRETKEAFINVRDVYIIRLL